MKKLAITFLIIGIFFQCKKKDEPQPEPVGQTSGITNSTIVGKVSQYDQFGLIKTSGLNTTTISINTSSSSTVTDALGNYTINNVPEGSYTLTSKSPSCRAVSNYSVVLSKNSVKALDISMCDTATYTFTSCLVRDSLIAAINTHYTYMKIGLTPLTGKAGVLVLFGSNQNVNIKDPNSYFDLITFQIPANVSTYDKYLANALPSGTTYLKIYPLPYNSLPIGQYYMVDSNKYMFLSNGDAIPGVYTVVR